MRKSCSYGRSRPKVRKTKYALSYNTSILLLTLVIWSGIVVSVLIFPWISNNEPVLQTMSEIMSCVTRGSVTVSDVVEVAYGWLIMLFVLFLSGMTAFGWPIILISVWSVGFRVGLEQCVSYREQGLLVSALTVCLPCVLGLSSILVNARQSMLLSASIANGLLAKSAGTYRVQRQFVMSLLCLLSGVCLIAVMALIQCTMTIIF